MIKSNSLQQTRKSLARKGLRTLATAVLSGSLLLGLNSKINARSIDQENNTNPQSSQELFYPSTSQPNATYESIYTDNIRTDPKTAPKNLTSRLGAVAAPEEDPGLIKHIYDPEADPYDEDEDGIYWERPTTFYREVDGEYIPFNAWGYGVKLMIPLSDELETALKEFPFYAADLIESTDENPVYLKVDGQYIKASSAGVFAPTGTTPDFVVSGISNLGTRPYIHPEEGYIMNPEFLEEITRLNLVSTDPNGQTDFDINLAYFTNKPYDKTEPTRLYRIRIPPFEYNEDYYWCSIKSLNKPMLSQPKRVEPSGIAFDIFGMNPNYKYQMQVSTTSPEGPWMNSSSFYNTEGSYAVRFRMTEIDFNIFPFAFIRNVMTKME